MKRINGIEFRQGVEKAAFKIAADLGMKVTLEWSNRITTAAISGSGHILLSSVADDAVVTQSLPSVTAEVRVSVPEPPVHT